MAKAVTKLKEGVNLLEELVKRLNKYRKDAKIINSLKVQVISGKEKITEDTLSKLYRVINWEITFYDENYKQLTETAHLLIKSLKELREKHHIKEKISTNPETADMFGFLLRLKQIRDPFIGVRVSLKRQVELTTSISKWSYELFEKFYDQQLASQKAISATVEKEYDLLTESIRMRSTVHDINKALNKLRVSSAEDSDYVFGVLLRCLFYMAGGIIGLSMLAPETSNTFNEIAARGPEMVKGIIGSVISLPLFGAGLYPAIIFLKKENRLARKRERVIHKLAKIKI